MIQEFINRFMAAKPKLESLFSQEHPESYGSIVAAVVTAISDNETKNTPDPSRIHEIDGNDCKGTLVYVIAEKGFQPRVYWYVKVDYGSCSQCDTLAGIRKYASEKPTPEQVSDYMTLALHIVQAMKRMDSESA